MHAQQTRRDLGPTTVRGAQRRSALLAAARHVFETRGFSDARVSDIVQQAGVSHGTFYTYFDTKETVFEAVCHQVIEDMLAAMEVTVTHPDVHGRVRDAVSRFVSSYRPHATMIGLMEQVGLFSPRLRELRQELRQAFVERARRGIGRMQAAGLTHDDLDVEYASEALGMMLEYTCYVWFSLERRFDEQRLIDTMTQIWVRTLVASPT